MTGGIYTVVGGAVAQERKLDFVAHNLSNALTPGYKAVKLVFEGIPSDSIVPSDTVPNTFVGTYNSYRDFSPGPLSQTGGTLDLAIEGAGFFVVETPNGTMYTRNGVFTLDKEKKLVTSNGDRVKGENGDIFIDGRDVSIEEDGTITVDRATVGKIKVVDFADRTYLQARGNSLYVNSDPAAAPEIPPERYSVKQGYYEASNVEVMKEMIDMITAVRAYETCSKIQQSFGDMSSKLLEIGKF